MAGWTVTFQSAGTSVTLANSVEASMVPTETATVAFILGDGQGDHTWVLLVDYTDPLNAVYGTPADLGLFTSAVELSCVIVPGRNQAIITRQDAGGGGGANTDYCVVSFNPATLAITSVGAWTRLHEPTGYNVPAAYDQPLLAFSSTQLVATAQMISITLGAQLIAVPMAFNGTTLTPGTPTVIPFGGAMVSPVLNGSLMYVVTATGQLVTVTAAGVTTLVKDPTVEGDGTPGSAFWRTGSNAGRLLRGAEGYYDVTLSTGTVGAFVAFSEPLRGVCTMGARSGDGTLDIVQGTGFSQPAATFQPTDVHPRASFGSSTSGPFPTPLIPLSGPHALGLINFGADIQVGRLDETLQDRFAEAAAHGSSSGLVGQTMLADLAYDHFEWSGGPDRPSSSLYWRAVTSWNLDWGDGTSSSGAGPIWAEPDTSARDVAFTLGHVYSAPGAYTVTFSVVDSLGENSTPNLTTEFDIDPSPATPPLRQRQRPTAIGAAAGPPLRQRGTLGDDHPPLRQRRTL